MKVQRLRVTFSRGDELKYITHLDLMRFWERALRRAQIPIAYSEGFSPHAQISLAAPLAVGTTSDGELMDVFLAERMTPRRFSSALAAQMPAGIGAREVHEVGLALPALQAAVRWAEYLVEIGPRTGPGGEAPVSRPPEGGLEPEAAHAIEAFLAAETVPWEHRREDEVRSYDIRAQVDELSNAGASADGGVRLRMRLKNDNSGSGRPEQVTAALGLPPPCRIHRERLILAEASPARAAWRAVRKRC